MIGGILLAILLVLGVFIRLIRGRKKEEIVVKLMREEPEAILGARGITISPGEVVIKAEGKTTRLPRDKVSVDMQGGKLEIRVLEPMKRTPPKVGPEIAAALKEVETPEEAEAVEKPVEEVVEKPKTLTSVMKDIARKHSLSSLTVITPEGLLVDSISRAPEEDASIASNLMSELELGAEASRAEFEAEEELRYLFAFPFKDGHVIFIARAREKLPEEALNALQEELGEGLELLPA